MGWTRFELRNGKSLVAAVNFSIENVQAKSPLRAPYGGIELYGKIQQDGIAVWWDQIRDSLRKQSVQELTLTMYPKLLNSLHFERVDKMLQNITGNMIVDEVASILKVDEKHFEEKIAAAKRYRLRKYRTLFQFEKIPLSKLDFVYTFLQKCRSEKGQTLS
ncbi:MAG: hypothetical protein ACKO96_30225, partial [Flammeovirgaceae bacterium]